MTAIDANSFDGDRVEAELAQSSGVKYRRTSISLVTMRQGNFVIVTGIDKEKKPFSDSQIETIFSTFESVVDSNQTDTPKALRQKIEAALASLWTPCPASKKCPFNLTIKYATRLVFHLHILGWSFEEARMKLKTRFKPGEFSDLSWLSLNGKSQKPDSFSIIDKDSEKKVFEFALYTSAAQADDGGVTRIIIDPEADNTGLGP